MERYMLFLAGGKGHRLWPLSRENVPKQFIKLPNGKSLLENTLDRVHNLSQFKKIIISTRQYINFTQQIANTYNISFLIEPESRNTAAAIAWALHELRLNTNEDAIITIMPTDHTILQESEFQSAIVHAANYAEHIDKIILFGCPQTYITSKFGFISYQKEPTIHIGNNAFPLHTVQNFHEKPSYADAMRYKQQETTVWNMGIFIGRLSVLWKLFVNYAPDIINNLDNYQNIPARSFDQVIVEQAASHALVLPCDFEWSDVGSLDTFIPAIQATQKNCIEIAGARRNSVISKKEVIISDVNDLIIIEMDDMIFIAHNTFNVSTEIIRQHVKNIGKEELL